LVHNLNILTFRAEWASAVVSFRINFGTLEAVGAETTTIKFAENSFTSKSVINFITLSASSTFSRVAGGIQAEIRGIETYGADVVVGKGTSGASGGQIETIVTIIACSA